MSVDRIVRAEVAAAYASHRETRDNLLTRCGCGAMYETRADEPAEMCKKCRNEARWRKRKAKLAARQETKLYNYRQYVLEYDASAWPMKAGYRLTWHEVDAGLRLGSWALGTRFRRADKVLVVTQEGLQ